MNWIKENLDFIDKHISYPTIYVINGASTNPEVVIDGKKALMFSSNNYLGLANEDRVKESVIDAVKKYGLGSGGSRLISGNTEIQDELEKRVAEYKRSESAITFSTGYMANLGLVSALMKTISKSALEYFKQKIFLAEDSVVFSDELNHTSIIDGIKLSKSNKEIYKHIDVQDLERRLEKHKKTKKKLIITDGVFSMDGDVCPLDKILELAVRYDAFVVVDDAHATGVIGETGRGTAEYCKVEGHDRLITVGTFTKAFGGVGGFVSGPEYLTRYLKVMANTFIFTAPIPPSIAAGLIRAIDIASQESEHRERLWNNVRYLRDQLNRNNFDCLTSETQIVPIFVGQEKTAVEVSRRLLERGIFVLPVRWPAVPHGHSRLRITVMSSHDHEQIDKLVYNLKEVRDIVNF